MASLFSLALRLALRRFCLVFSRVCTLLRLSTQTRLLIAPSNARWPPPPPPPLCSRLTDDTLQRPLKALLALTAGSLRSNVPVLIVLKCNQHLGSGGANNLNLTEHLRRPSESGPHSSPQPPGGTNGFMLCGEEEDEEEVGGGGHLPRLLLQEPCETAHQEFARK